MIDNKLKDPDYVRMVTNNGAKVPAMLATLKEADRKYYFPVGDEESDLMDFEYDIMRATLKAWNDLEPSDEVTAYVNSVGGAGVM